MGTPARRRPADGRERRAAVAGAKDEAGGGTSLNRSSWSRIRQLQLPSCAPFPEGGFPISKSQTAESLPQRGIALSMLVVLLVVEDRAADVSASRAARQSAAASYEIRTLVPTCISRGARPCDFSL